MFIHRHRRGRVLGALLAAALVVAACASDDASDDTPDPDPATDSEDDADDADASDDTDDTDEPGDDEVADGDVVTIDYFSFSAAPDHLDALQAIVDDFEAANPDVRIEVSTAPFDDYFTTLQTRVAGGQAPDTFELNYENFVTYAESGSLLDPDAAAPGAIDADRFYPEALQAFQRDGTQYGLPQSFSAVVLFYNQDLFDEAGVDHPDVSWTWEDELEAARALTDPDAGVWGTFQPVSFFEFFKVLAQNGGEFFDADGQPAFDSPEGVEAAEWLIDKVGEVMPTEAEMGGQDDGGMFASGQLAMWHSGIWMFTAMAETDFTWDVAVEPGNVDDASHFFANGIVASATTEHPEAAARWMNHLAGSDVAVESRLDASWELPAVADTSLFAPYLEQTPPANRQAVFDSLDSIVVPPVIEAQQQMQDLVGDALQRALLGQASVEDALSDAADQVAELLD